MERNDALIILRFNKSWTIANESWKLSNYRFRTKTTRRTPSSKISDISTRWVSS